VKKRTQPDLEETSVNSRDFYTVSEIADLLELNELTIYRYAKSDELPAFQIARLFRFRGEDIQGFVKKRRMSARKRKRARHRPDGATTGMALSFRALAKARKQAFLPETPHSPKT